VSVQATYYSKTTSDALVNRPLPGSLGAGASRIENVGVVTNKGAELSLNVRAWDSDKVRWDVGIEASENNNKLVSLAPGIPPLTGFGFQNRPGYPLFGLWWPKLVSYADANNNQTIEPGEVVVTDTAVFIGATIPVRSLSLSNSVSLFGDKLRLSGLLDYRAGFVSHNVNGLFQCAFRQNCAALHVKGYDLEEQAKAVAGPRAFGAYGEQADFLRFREFSVQYTLPGSVARVLRASSANAQFTGRNLWTWTKEFTAWDPENNTSQPHRLGDRSCPRRIPSGRRAAPSVALRLSSSPPRWRGVPPKPSWRPTAPTRSTRRSSPPTCRARAPCTRAPSATSPWP
jgi:hypothetical protein